MQLETIISEHTDHLKVSMHIFGCFQELKAIQLFHVHRCYDKINIMCFLFKNSERFYGTCIDCDWKTR